MTTVVDCKKKRNAFDTDRRISRFLCDQVGQLCFLCNSKLLMRLHSGYFTKCLDKVEDYPGLQHRKLSFNIGSSAYNMESAIPSLLILKIADFVFPWTTKWRGWVRSQTMSETFSDVLRSSRFSATCRFVEEKVIYFKVFFWKVMFDVTRFGPLEWLSSFPFTIMVTYFI